jgi:hypothetical protein
VSEQEAYAGSKPLQLLRRYAERGGFTAVNAFLHRLETGTLNGRDRHRIKAIYLPDETRLDRREWLALGAATAAGLTLSVTTGLGLKASQDADNEPNLLQRRRRRDEVEKKYGRIACPAGLIFGGCMHSFLHMREAHHERVERSPDYVNTIAHLLQAITPLLDDIARDIEHSLNGPGRYSRGRKAEGP